ncbi:MAG: toxin-antitoxin system YwqK family antitoxin [Bacteroidota bacterium]|nr:toxin-antitoxin system YwqK family antitoxin [Bacteroidota bacterium]
MKSLNNSSKIKMIILAVLLVSSGIAYSQNQLSNQVDATGKKQGLWKKYDGSVLVSKGTYKDGYPEGEFTYYYENGSVKAVSLFSEKAQKVVSTSFYRSGIKMSEGTYFNKKKDGEWKYYTEDKVLLAAENYKIGNREGVWKSYYPNGTLNLEAHYLSNNKSGVWKSFFPDGQLKSVMNYLNNLLEGKIEYYFPGMKIMISGSYLKGMQEGKWLYYDQSGKLIRTEEYKNGILKFREGVVPEVNDTIKLPEPPKY